MKKEQEVRQDEALFNTDLLAWRVLSAKKQTNQITRNRVYNDRPRLRDEAHH